jgi:hypothetical protein
MRKPLVATVLVSAVAGALITGLTPVAAASPDTTGANRGWEASTANRGWDHEERAAHSPGAD